MPDHCHCGMPRQYEDCCGALHQGLAVAETAEQLMRSRFSAFARGDVTYIINSQTPSPPKGSRPELEQDMASTRWLKLEVHRHQSLSGTEASVEFSAYALSHGTLLKHHEVSEFCRQNNQWFYQQGDILPDSGPLKWPRNAPCICGRERKYKQCCGR